MSVVRSIAALALLMVLAGPAQAEPAAEPAAERDRYARLPAEMEGVGLGEKLGQTIPLDLPFSGADGTPITLRAILDRGLPVLLTFNYSDCPVLCSTQLELLSQALAKLPDTPGALPLRPGRQYQIVTIALDPAQTADKSRRMRDTYVKRFPAATADEVRAGWHFLTGPEASVRLMADAIGMSYRYRPGRGEYVHPALVTFLSTDGMIIRYVKGVQYEPLIISESIFAAGTSAPRDSVGFILTCFHYDPEDGSCTGVGRSAMKFGAAGFVVALMLVLAAWHHVRTRRGRKESA